MGNKESKNERYAFIDAYNTINTTEKLLNFSIDWDKLYAHLKNRWKCKKVFFYSGIDIGDVDTEQEYERLKKLGYIVQSKTTIPYKNPDKKISVKCKQCGFENLETISMGHKKKSNCDVELGVDAINNAGLNKEFMIFTGDGDFEYLIKDLTETKGVFVYIISNRSKNTITSKRFSHKLRELFKHQNVRFIDINSWKEIIKR